ncbi:MAG: hypothetical protein HYI21_13010 [Sediminibacterium sp. Gen4]|jgi:hypothetical protein|uniref:hypothetical protein n=1 Tax=unclassified Sediminibacterium TaxID=2635961 RepID=UPI0015BC5532|nr:MULTISPECIES: hypothetical protein [unclassified Sediminibacterium]NWK66944.1 hypothetical protein [Sediminibacterium sp. Gen4]
MQTMDAHIKISRNGDKITSISVLTPIWNKISEHGNLIVSIPMLGIETIAKNDDDAEIAIKEAITSFCIISEKFGQGLEKELQALGWIAIDQESGEPLLGYNIEDTDSLLQRIMQTGEEYLNPHLEIA